MLEKDIEDRVCRYAKKLGITAEKFTSPAKRSVPDRLLTFKVESGVAPNVFIEFKATGKRATPKQSLDHSKRRKQGSLVYVIDDVTIGKSVVDTLCIILSHVKPMEHAPVPSARSTSRSRP